MSTTTQTEGAATAAKALISESEIAEILATRARHKQGLADLRGKLKEAEDKAAVASHDDEEVSAEVLYDRQAQADREVGILKIHIQRAADAQSAYEEEARELLHSVCEKMRLAIIPLIEARRVQVDAKVREAAGFPASPAAVPYNLGPAVAGIAASAGPVAPLRVLNDAFNQITSPVNQSQYFTIDRAAIHLREALAFL